MGNAEGRMKYQEKLSTPEYVQYIEELLRAWDSEAANYDIFLQTAIYSNEEAETETSDEPSRAERLTIIAEVFPPNVIVDVLRELDLPSDEIGMVRELFDFSFQIRQIVLTHLKQIDVPRHGIVYGPLSLLIYRGIVQECISMRETFVTACILQQDDDLTTAQRIFEIVREELPHFSAEYDLSLEDWEEIEDTISQSLDEVLKSAAKD